MIGPCLLLVSCVSWPGVLTRLFSRYDYLIYLACIEMVGFAAGSMLPLTLILQRHGDEDLLKNPEDAGLHAQYKQLYLGELSI